MLDNLLNELNSSILDKFFDTKKIISKHYDNSKNNEFEDTKLFNNKEKQLHTEHIE